MDALVYGRNHEAQAKLKYSELHDTEVHNCGIFVSEEYPFLAASPGKSYIDFDCGPHVKYIIFDVSDGVIAGHNKIVEIKCPISAKNFESPDDLFKPENKLKVCKFL